MSQIKPHVIESQTWQVGTLSETGASIAYGRINVGGRWLDFMRPTPENEYNNPSACADFVLVPWSNRIREGRFDFEGTRHQLQVNSKDGTAMHGVGRKYPWHVDSSDGSHVVMSLRSVDHADVNFPFKFSSRVEYRAEGPKFMIITSLINVDSKPFPAGFGHHPYFQRTLAGDSDKVSLEIPCSEYFKLENALPSDAAEPITPLLDFRTLRPLGQDAIDDCLTGREEDKPVRFQYGESGKEIDLSSDPIFACMILYAPVGQTFFAAEPVTNANDGFNLREKGIPGSGVFVLQPGEEKSGTMTFEVVA